MTGGVALLDVNVLVALLWPRHIHHEAARTWFGNARTRGWATCPITQMGCIRVLSNRAVAQGAISVPDAAELLRQLLADAHHTFWPDDLALTDALIVASLPHLQGANQLTDRYLLALAAAHKGLLATFDRTIGTALPARSQLLGHLEVIGS